MGGVMSPIIVVIADDGQGKPSLPNSLVIDGVRRPLRPEPATLANGFALREYRIGGESIIAMRVAVIPQGVVAVMWLPCRGRAFAAGWLARVTGTDLSSLVSRQWACEIDPVTGAITSAALTAATGTIPNAVRAAWPVSWYLRTGDESPGDRAGTPPGAPQGALCIGATIA